MGSARAELVSGSVGDGVAAPAAAVNTNGVVFWPVTVLVLLADLTTKALAEAALGPPLGLASTSRSRQAEGRLALGETLVLYTDGLVERRGVELEARFGALAAADFGLLRAVAQDQPGEFEFIGDRAPCR